MRCGLRRGQLRPSLPQQPELVAQLYAQLAERRLSGRKRSVAVHDAPKLDGSDGDHNASASTTPPTDPASSKPSGPPRKRRREASNMAANDENKSASSDETPRLAKRARSVLQMKNGNAVGQATGQLSNSAKNVRLVKVSRHERQSFSRCETSPCILSDIAVRVCFRPLDSGVFPYFRNLLTCRKYMKPFGYTFGMLPEITKNHQKYS